MQLPSGGTLTSCHLLARPQTTVSTRPNPAEAKNRAETVTRKVLWSRLLLHPTLQLTGSVEDGFPGSGVLDPIGEMSHGAEGFINLTPQFRSSCSVGLVLGHTAKRDR